MNKRPLLLMFVCFVLGEAGIYMQAQWSIVVTAAGAVLLGVWYAYTNGVRPVLLLFVFFYFWGMFCCREAQKPSALEVLCQEEKVEITVTGQVERVEDGSKGCRIYLNQLRYVNGEEWYTSRNKLIIVTESTPSCKLGQRIRCEGRVQPLEHARNPGGFDAYRYYRGRNVVCQMEGEQIEIMDSRYWWIRETLRQLRWDFAARLQILLSSKEAGILQAILLGEKSNLDDSIKKQYQQAGISHIIAISGLHIGFMGMVLLGILRRFQLPNTAASLIAAAGVFLYAFLAGMSASCERAAIMFAVVLLAKVVGRAYDLLSAMALAGLVILWRAPLQFLDAGFLLSFGAILGIGAVYPCLSAGYGKKEKSWKTKCKDNFLCSVSVQLVTMPVIAYFYYEIPIYAVFLNLVVIPLMSLLLPSAVIGLLLSYVRMEWGRVVLFPATLVLKCNELLSSCSNRFPFAHFVTGQPSWWQLLLYAGVGILFLIWFSERRGEGKGKKRGKTGRAVVIAGIVVVSGVVIGIVQGSSNSLRITMLDVGQGDGLVLELPQKKTILMDGGSSTESGLYDNIYAPFLKSRGITKVDYAIVSHSDMDHIKAVRELLQEGFPIGTLVLPDISQPDEVYLELCCLAEKRGIPVRKWFGGKQYWFGQCQMLCLNPQPGSSGEDTNADSLAILLRYQSFSMLFTGDLEGKGEEQVTQWLREVQENSCTVLKVAHHGSKNSTSEDFLKQVHPFLSLISCGKNNRYGHPHQEVLNRLDACGTKTLITSNTGAVTVWTDGQKMEWEE